MIYGRAGWVWGPMVLSDVLYFVSLLKKPCSNQDPGIPMLGVQEGGIDIPVPGLPPGSPGLWQNEQRAKVL